MIQRNYILSSLVLLTLLMLTSSILADDPPCSSPWTPGYVDGFITLPDGSPVPMGTPLNVTTIFAGGGSYVNNSQTRIVDNYYKVTLSYCGSSDNVSVTCSYADGFGSNWTLLTSSTPRLNLTITGVPPLVITWATNNVNVTTNETPYTFSLTTSKTTSNCTLYLNGTIQPVNDTEGTEFNWSVAVIHRNYTNFDVLCIDTYGFMNWSNNSWLNVDLVAPTVSWSSGNLNAVTNDSTPTLNVTTSETVSLCRITLNGTNRTMTGSGTAWTYTPTSNLSDGNYTGIKAYCWDLAGNRGNSTPGWIYVDTHPLSVNWSFPEVNSIITTSEVNITVNVSEDVDWCKLGVTNATGWYISYDMLNASPTWYTNFSNLDEGNHTLNVTCNDGIQSYRLGPAWLDVDTIIPLVTWDTQTNATLMTDTYTAQVNTHLDVLSCTLDVNGTSYNMTNTSTTEWSYELASVAYNNYTLSVSCVDDAGHVGNSSSMWVNLVQCYYPSGTGTAGDPWIVSCCGGEAGASGYYEVNSSATLEVTDTYSCVYVTADDVTIDGNGSTITGNLSDDVAGVVISGRDNVTVKNLIAVTLEWGIVVENDTNVDILNNSISNCTYALGIEDESFITYAGANNFSNNSVGVYIEDSDNSTIFNNTLNNNSYSLIVLMLTENTTIDSNQINGNGVGILTIFAAFNNITNNTICNNTAGIYLDTWSMVSNLSYNVIENNSETGIYMYQGVSNSIFENNFSGNSQYAIVLENASLNTIRGNNFSDENVSILINGSSQVNNISENNINVSITGILINASNNTILTNVINSSDWGIWIEGNNNTVLGNTVTNSDEVGLYLADGAENNSIDANILCSNDVDIMAEVTGENSGDNNTCTVYTNWADDSVASGCRYICGATTVSACRILNNSNTVYQLTADIPNDDGDCFIINESNITLNLAGFTVDGDNDTDGAAVKINATAPYATVFSGVLTQFKIGVNISAANATVYDLIINDTRGTGIWVLANNANISNSMIYDLDRPGVALNNTNSTTLSDLTIYLSSLSGIDANIVGGLTIEDLTVYNCSGNGIEISNGNDTTITNILSTNNSASGVYITASNITAISNLISVDNSENGVYVINASGTPNDTTITDATISSNDDMGIRVLGASSTTISNVIANQNAADGLLVTFSNTTTVNNLTANSNYRRGITGGLVVGLNINDSTCNYNNGTGMYFQYINYSTIANSTASYNNGSGLMIWTNDSTVNNTNITVTAVTLEFNQEDGVGGFDVVNSTMTDSVMCFNDQSAGAYYDAAHDMTTRNLNATNNTCDTSVNWTEDMQTLGCTNRCVAVNITKTSTVSSVCRGSTINWRVAVCNNGLYTVNVSLNDTELSKTHTLSNLAADACSTWSYTSTMGSSAVINNVTANATNNNSYYNVLGSATVSRRTYNCGGGSSGSGGSGSGSMVIYSPTLPTETCGNGNCAGNETCLTCPEDCGKCVAKVIIENIPGVGEELVMLIMDADGKFAEGVVILNTPQGEAIEVVLVGGKAKFTVPEAGVWEVQFTDEDGNLITEKFSVARQTEPVVKPDEKTTVEDDIKKIEDDIKEIEKEASGDVLPIIIVLVVIAVIVALFFLMKSKKGELGSFLPTKAKKKGLRGL